LDLASKEFHPHQSQCSARSLLIVDDQPLLAEYMATVAEDHGLNVEVACTASEFETKLENVRPDAVALDLAMPDRDGVELLRYLSKANYGGSILIISACELKVLETSVRLGRELGLNVVGSIQKPIKAGNIEDLLDRAFKESS